MGSAKQQLTFDADRGDKVTGMDSNRNLLVINGGVQATQQLPDSFGHRAGRLVIGDAAPRHPLDPVVTLIVVHSRGTSTRSV